MASGAGVASGIGVLDILGFNLGEWEYVFIKKDTTKAAPLR